MRGVFPVVAVLVAGLLAGCGAGPAATPDAVVHERFTDPTGDVFDVAWPAAGPVDAGLPNVDLVAADLRHTGSAVRIRLTFDRMERRPARGWHVGLYLETDRGREYRVGFTRAQYDDAKGWFRSWGIMRFDSESALSSPCDGPPGRSLPRPRVDRSAATLIVDIPVRCVGRPRWVEVHDLEAVLMRSRRVDLVDNAFADTADSDTVVRLRTPPQ